MLSVQIQICIPYYLVFITPKVHWTFYITGGIPTKAYFLHGILTAVYTVTVILLVRIALIDMVVLFILFLSDSDRIEARIHQIFNRREPLWRCSLHLQNLALSRSRIRSNHCHWFRKLNTVK